MGIGPVVAHHTVTVGTGIAARAPDMAWPVAGTPARTIDRAAGKAGSIVDKAVVVAGKAAARAVYSTCPHPMLPPSWP